MGKALKTLLLLILFTASVRAQSILPQILAPAPSSSGITVVEYLCGNNLGSGGCQGNGTSSVTITLGTSTTSGELIFLITQSGPTGSSYGSVTDSASQTYTQDTTLRKTGMGAHFASTVWYKCGSAAGVTTVTWTYGTSDTQASSKIIVAHVKGLKSSSCLDTSANFPSSASNTPFTSSSITPASGHNEWIVGVGITTFGTATTVSATAPFTLENIAGATASSNFPFLADYIVTSTSGSYSFSGSGTSGTAIYWPAIIAFTQ